MAIPGYGDGEEDWLQELIDYNRQALSITSKTNAVKSKYKMIYIGTSSETHPQPRPFYHDHGSGQYWSTIKVSYECSRLDHLFQHSISTLCFLESRKHIDPYTYVNIYIHILFIDPSTPCDFSPLAAVMTSRTSNSAHWSMALDSTTLKLPRTRECFQLIENDIRLGYDLPRPNQTAGAILKHCYRALDQTLEKYQPCIYKIGFTHCAYWRFFNDLYGYVREKDQWEKMKVLYASHEAISPSFVEGAMIQRHIGYLMSI